MEKHGVDTWSGAYVAIDKTIKLSIQMKKTILICAVLFTFIAVDAQVNVVRCTEDEYKRAFMGSMVLCACMPSSPAELTPADSMRIDSVLRYHFLAAEGYDSPAYELWWNKRVLQRVETNIYIVEYGPEIKGSGDPVGDRTAFIDTLFHPLGSIVGGHTRLHCCSNYVATLEVALSEEPPILHLYRWAYSYSAFPEEIGLYAPKNIVIQNYCYDLGNTLYVKGYELVDGLYAGDTVYLKVNIE